MNIKWFLFSFNGRISRQPFWVFSLCALALWLILSLSLGINITKRGNPKSLIPTPAELLQLRQVTFSGEGEPTLSPCFGTAVRAVAHVRALGRFPFFKIVVISNATGLDKPAVRAGLESLSANDELWLKLDGGSQEYLDRINRPSVPIEKVLENILAVGRERPVIIQSLFPRLNGEDPPPAEIERYVDRLRELRVAGAQITLVQVYSAMRPGTHPECGHLSLRSLSTIAQTIRAGTGLTVEVF